jgi:tyrosyl-tRNA synthetase
MPNATDAAAEDDAQLASRLAGNAVDSLPEGALEDKLRAARAQGRALRLKLGIDPTAPDIHLGHAVVLLKLREFQDAGHRVVLIVGDYTARVGDPSGRSSVRPMPSAGEIEANATTFNAQALKILDSDPERLEVRHNSEWLDMPMSELLALMRTTTAAQLLEREDFARRLSANEPISMLELLYPLLQGYDSVAVRADVEVGGTDQKFNLLLGRDVQRAYAQPAQAILTMPILVGTDGYRKMSKSLGNQIGVTDSPEEIYGKTMAIPDQAIPEYHRLLVDPQSTAADHSAPSPAGRALGQPSQPSPRDAKRSPVSWSAGCTPPRTPPRPSATSIGCLSNARPPRRSLRRDSIATVVWSTCLVSWPRSSASPAPMHAG